MANLKPDEDLMKPSRQVQLYHTHTATHVVVNFDVTIDAGEVVTSWNLWNLNWKGMMDTLLCVIEVIMSKSSFFPNFAEGAEEADWSVFSWIGSWFVEFGDCNKKWDTYLRVNV